MSSKILRLAVVRRLLSSLSRAFDRMGHLVRPVDQTKAVLDLGLIVAAACWTWLISFSQVPNPGNPLPFVLAIVCARVIIYYSLRLRKMSWLQVSRHEIFRLAVSAALGPPLIAFLLWVLPDPFTLNALYRPYLVLATEPVLYLMLLSAVRVTARAMVIERRREGRSRRILIVGALDAGRSLAFQIQESATEYEIAGFVDDNAALQGRRIRGLPVLGTTDALPDLVRQHEVQEVVIAIPSLSPNRLRQLLMACEPTGAPVRILPPLRDLIGGRADFKSLREVRMEDLLPRPEVKLDRDAISRYLHRRTALVTGGGGSIGGELCRQILATGITRLLVLGRGENSVFEMVQELSEVNGLCELIPVVCDVRDRPALEQVIKRWRPEVIFHAAAHKHVPLMERYPCEAVKNNVVGTLNVVRLAVEYNVERFVMVSTDKAVDPTSIMGATKRLCEMIVKGYAAESGSNMVCVRFGNVLGSRGSVVPTMARQIRRGLPVTVTDPDMVRYFMTIPEAVQLILQAGAVGGSGEVFILDMGHPVRILDLAHDLIRLSGLVPDQDIPIRIIGRRPGEKMKEDILTSREVTDAHKNGPFYVVSSQTVELPILLGHIEKLHAMSQLGRDDEVLKLIQRIIPEFQPNPTRPSMTAVPAPAVQNPATATEIMETSDTVSVNGTYGR